MGIFSQPLVLKKRHDFCAAKVPKLTVVLIHGIASDATTYAHALSYLEGTVSLREVRFVTFDLLGAGESRKSDKLEYTYAEQLEALHNAIEKLKVATPLVLVGHSMGTLIVARYASMHKSSVRKLVLISPPVYTAEDLASPAFTMGMKAFRDAVSLKVHKVSDARAFENSMKNIVLNQRNYEMFTKLATPTVMIYGNMDQIIAPHNIPKLLKDNPEYITAIKTEGKHSVTRDKYTKLVGILEEILNA